MNPSHSKLEHWLSKLETLHPKPIDLGLERVEQVRKALALTPTCPIITVAGTNGKGSVCALISSMLRAAGFRVGTYTSPHLIRYNERIRINMQVVEDQDILESFERIDTARQDISLSYFEFGTLAAVDIFMRHQVEVMVLEVGLGGRLDAVNIFDADVAIVTQIDLDHTDWLGDTREAIGREKAGIFRAHRPVVCIDSVPPNSLLEHAQALNCPISILGRDFFAHAHDSLQWCYQSHTQTRAALPMPALRGNYQMVHAAGVLAALEALKDKLPVNMQAIRRGLVEVEWAGRFQVLAGRPLIVLDVGHNPHAARALADNLTRLPFAQKRFALFSALADKDVAAVIEPLKHEFDAWFIASIDHPRALSREALKAIFAAQHIEHVHDFSSLEDAGHAALSLANEDDRLVIFGSFFTVSALINSPHLSQRHITT